jgi:excisionase family DNA binding protein
MGAGKRMADFRHRALYYTAKQAASKLGRNVRQFEELIRAGRLRMVTIGNKEAIPTRAVDDLLEGDTAKSGESPDPPQQEVVDAPGVTPERQTVSGDAQRSGGDHAPQEEEDPAGCSHAHRRVREARSPFPPFEA